MKVNGSNYVLKSDAVLEGAGCLSAGLPVCRTAGLLLVCWSAGLPDFGLPAMR
jgi:hypothetical protein